MARIDTLKNFLVDIADKLRSILGTTEEIAHAEYDAKIDEVFEAGKSAERNAMWDVIQIHGNRTDYQYAFNDWTDVSETFYPKYDIKPSGSITHMFGDFNTWYMKNGVLARRNDQYSTGGFDLAERLKECNVVLDTSNVTTVGYAFLYCFISHIPTLDFRNVTAFGNGMLQYCKATHTIDKIILSDKGANIGKLLLYANGLKDVRFEGKIIKGFAAASSPFTAESGENIFKHLENYAGTDEEGEYSISLNSRAWDNLNTSGAPPVGNTWQEYAVSLGYTV